MDNSRDTPCILVVEDNSLVLEHVVSVLKSLGYDVISASSGAEALAELQTADHVDLLFTDMVMPGGISGKVLADLALQKQPDLKVLFTTGYSADVVATHGGLGQTGDLLKKPYRKAQLEQKLGEIFGDAAP